VAFDLFQHLDGRYRAGSGRCWWCPGYGAMWFLGLRFLDGQRPDPVGAGPGCRDAIQARRRYGLPSHVAGLPAGHPYCGVATDPRQFGSPPGGGLPATLAAAMPPTSEPGGEHRGRRERALRWWTWHALTCAGGGVPRVRAGEGASAESLRRPPDEEPIRSRPVLPGMGAGIKPDGAGQRLVGARRSSREPGAAPGGSPRCHRGPDVVSLRLTRAPGVLVRSLPAWRPGRNLDVVLPSGLVRSTRCAAIRRPASYRIAVRRSPTRGGSREVQGCAGAEVTARVRARRSTDPGAAVPVRGRRHRDHADPADVRAVAATRADCGSSTPPRP